MRKDATVSMPPYELWMQGSEFVRTWLLGMGSGCRGSRLLPSAAPALPAFGQYRPDPAGGNRAWASIVIKLPGIQISALNNFHGIAPSLAERKEIMFTNDAGGFRFAPLPAGAYSLSVGKEGFANFEMTSIGGEDARNTNLRVTLPGEGTEQQQPDRQAQLRSTSAIRVGGNLQASKLVSKVIPLYTADARNERVEGIVLFRNNIGADGAITGLSPMNQLVDKRFLDSASTAVRQWRYQPTLLNGNPIEVITENQVNFTLTQ